MTHRLLSEAPATIHQAVGGPSGVSLSTAGECRARRVGAEGAAEQLAFGVAA